MERLEQYMTLFEFSKRLTIVGESIVVRRPLWKEEDNLQLVFDGVQTGLKILGDVGYISIDASDYEYVKDSHIIIDPYTGNTTCLDDIDEDLTEQDGNETNNNLMDFSEALTMLKKGKRIFRHRWNGKGMFVAYQKGYPLGIPCNKQTAAAWGLKEGDLFKCNPYMQIKCVNGTYSMWVPSINDILAEDWECL